MSALVQHLPLEITQEIFQYFSTPFLLHNLSSFPWYLGHICSSWRAIFLSMTFHFWNRLDIDLDFMDSLYESPYRTTMQYRLMLDALYFFICRSRTGGHSFSFQLERKFQWQEAEAYIDTMLMMLVEESMRWENVFIRFGASQLPILYRAKDRLPLLRSAQLLRSRFDGETEPFKGLFDNLPRLNQLNLSRLSDWMIDWTRLRVLKIGQFSEGDELFSILSQATELEKLAIYTSVTAVVSDMPIGVFTFASLRVLTLTDVKPLSALNAPALEELYINDWEEEGIVDSTINSFLTRSSCNLKRFGMTGCSASSLSNLLKRTPDLVHLSLDNDMDMIKSFGELTFHHQRRNKLPAARRLQSLTIMDPGLSNMELMELSTLIMSRAKQVRDEGVVKGVLVEKLNSLSIVMLDQVARYQKRSAVERLKKQCEEQDVQLSVRNASNLPWPRHDNTRILDW